MIYYTYCPKKFVFLKAVEADTQPANSSPWKPPEDDDYAQSYFNGDHWVRCAPQAQMTQDVLRAVAISELRKKFNAKIRHINAGVAAEEISTYAQQAAEARAYLNHGTLGTYLNTLSAVRGLEPSDLAARIVDKVDDYERKMATALGEYQNAVAALPEELVLTQEMLHSALLVR